MDTANQSRMTVIIPAYNDAEGLRRVLDELLPEAQKHQWQVTIVNDYSTDHTAEVLKSYGSQIKVLTNHRNLGYGASIKRGILNARTEWVATMDADGQHRLEDLLKMYDMLGDDVDALLGSRTKDSHAPLARRPGKWVLRHTANFMANYNIPDINCGLRVLRRNIMLDLFSITSDRFSFSTSTTIVLLQLGCRVHFVPVVVEARVGKSTVKQLRDGLYTILLIIRLIFLFHPLRVILPIGIGLMALSFLLFCVSLFSGISAPRTILLLFLSGLQIFLISLVADQNSSLRRDYLLNRIRIEQLGAKRE